MDEKKVTNVYEKCIEENFADVETMSSDYRDGYYDGAYSFYAALLGEPRNA